jgi:hypothetical protein
MTATPQPHAFAGPIPCSRATLTRYMWAPPFNRFRDFEEGLFVECLLEASSRRSMKAGHAGLMLEAARLFVAIAKGSAQRFYAEQGGVTNWTDRDLAAAAVEIAEWMATDRMMRRKAEAALKAIRNSMYVGQVPTGAGGIEYVVCNGEEKIKGGVQIVFDASTADKNEEPMQTFIRTLDYIDFLSRLPGYSSLFALKRDLTAYLRVCHCICELDY